MLYTNEILQQIVAKVNDLFIDTRYKHLIQTKNGSYITSNTKDNDKRKAKAQAEGKRFIPYTPLADWKIKQHLEGKQTMGVFGQSFGSKFLTFDVDFDSDIQLSKWNTLKVVYTLIELGVPAERIYVSSSGNKGFHVDLYFSSTLSNKKMNMFYQLVMERCGYKPNKDNSEEIVRYETNGGMIEQRPVGLNQGVKLPLGVHQKTVDKKRCYYVDVDNNFAPLAMDYILTIEKLDVDVINTILDEHTEFSLEGEIQAVKQTRAFIESKYKPLPIYEQGLDEQATLEAFEKLEREGLTVKGTRNNSTMKVARYYKHLGYTEEEVVTLLDEWLHWQDRYMYDTPLETCYKEHREIARLLFKRDLGIVTRSKKVEITYNEMVQILEAKKKNNKLTLFAMLMHSKHYANKNGVFYMTYKQLSETTTLTEKNARENMKKLVEQGLVEIVAQNQSIKGTHIKKPNKYKVNIVVDAIEGENKTINLDTEESIENMFNKALVNLIPLDELKKKLPRRHYEEVRALYKEIA